MSKRCMTLFLAIVLAGCGGEKAEHAAAETPAGPPTPSRDTARHLAGTPARRTAADWLQSFRHRGPRNSHGRISYRRTPIRTTGPTKYRSNRSATRRCPTRSMLLKSIADDQRKTCEKFSDHETFSGVENDYPTSVRLFVCSVNPLTKKGQLTLVKTIRGDSHFYVITRARNVSRRSKRTRCRCRRKSMAEWSLYLRAIKACSDSRPAPPLSRSADQDAGRRPHPPNQNDSAGMSMIAAD